MDEDAGSSNKLSAARTTIWTRKQPNSRENPNLENGETQNIVQEDSEHYLGDDNAEPVIQQGEIRAQKKNSKIDYHFLRVNIFWSCCVMLF